MSLINRVYSDLSKILNNNTVVKFTDKEGNSINVNCVVSKKDENYNPIENVLVVAPQHKIILKKDSLDIEKILEYTLEWTDASGELLRGEIKEHYISNTMSTITLYAKVSWNVINREDDYE